MPSGIGPERLQLVIYKELSFKLGCPVEAESRQKSCSIAVIGHSVIVIAQKKILEVDKVAASSGGIGPDKLL